MPTRVYSPSGEPFDIPRRDLADSLILNEGWTQNEPEKRADVPKDVSSRRTTSNRKTRLGK